MSIYDSRYRETNVVTIIVSMVTTVAANWLIVVNAEAGRLLCTFHFWEFVFRKRLSNHRRK